MRTTVGLALLCALPLTAAAQPGATPYYAQPPPAVAPAVEVEPKVRLEIGLLAAGPRGDWKTQLAAGTSPGFHLQLGFVVAPNISLFGGLRYISVKPDEQGAFPEGYELSHRELQLGLRYTSPMSPTSKLFIEGNVHNATIAADYQGEGQQVSGVGLGIRGGMMFMVDRKIGIGGAVAYTNAGIAPEGNGGGEDFEDAWLSGDLFVAFGF